MAMNWARECPYARSRQAAGELEETKSARHLCRWPQQGWQQEDWAASPRGQDRRRPGDRTGGETAILGHTGRRRDDRRGQSASASVEELPYFAKRVPETLGATGTAPRPAAIRPPQATGRPAARRSARRGPQFSRFRVLS